MNFIPGNSPSHSKDSEAYWFLFCEDQMLIDAVGADAAEDRYCLPLASRDKITFNIESEHYLGTLDGHPCYFGAVSWNPDSGIQDIPASLSFMKVRDLYEKMAEDLFWLIGRAFHLLNWDRHTIYCGDCGAPTENMIEERAKICPRCHQVTYPRISPAIIVAIIKDKQILLARNRKLPADLRTVIAGFVEPGESLEECVRREIREEVGIEVKNIRYFASQPWPFPDSLMVAFIAEYGGGEIKVDGEEIVEAGWYSAENLPTIPGKISVARKLIDWFREHYCR
jgi:NAD+ diphosphatase